ncbi:MAG: hypothetical protein JWM80_6055 [Cyanobacteria bacterium RYN_339]|nr:hypothetical protein [Cyanobacteria bacterium RYN_339]
MTRTLFQGALAAALLLSGCGKAAMIATAAAPGLLAARADVASAADLARRTLRTNTHPVKVNAAPRDRNVVFAGGGHFGSLWARDGMYACLGLLAAGELPTVHDTLTALLDNQRADGLLPRRIGNGSNALGIIRSAIGLAPQAGNEMKSVDFAKLSVDANALVIWVAADYAAKAQDRAFTASYLPALERAEAWLFARMEGGLLKQDAYCDWKDMNARGGKVLYSNALYYKALKSLAALELDPTRAATYETRAEALATHIQAAFWDPTAGHFRDTLELNQFSPDGDLFAVLVGLTTPAQREAVFARCDALLTLRPLLPALDGDYPAAMIPLQMKLAGLSDYHDRFEWPWLTSLYAWAAAGAGETARARTALARVGTYALRDGTFEEIYEGAEPKPVKRALYASEIDFSWSAGMFLAADAANR